MEKYHPLWYLFPLKRKDPALYLSIFAKIRHFLAFDLVSLRFHGGGRGRLGRSKFKCYSRQAKKQIQRNLAPQHEEKAVTMVKLLSEPK